MNDVAVRRPYRQTARAAAAEQRTQAMLDAAAALFAERPWEQVTLAAIAERAGVGLQTVVRRFGSKDGVAEALVEHESARLTAARRLEGDPTPEAVAERITGHYEDESPLLLRIAHQAGSSPVIAEAAAIGVRMHREWVGRTFAAALGPLPAPDRAIAEAQLAAVCGIECWEVLRHHAGLDPDQTARAVAGLIRGVLDAAR